MTNSNYFNLAQMFFHYRNSSSSEDDEAPVQGPINREPFEKLYPGVTPGESGIRKLYVNLNIFKICI